MEFVKENVNPKGWKTGDCVVRAIAKASSRPWEEVYRELCEIGAKKCRMPNDPKVYETYLENHGWVKHKMPRRGDKTRYKVRDFLDELYSYSGAGWMIISVANHLTCARALIEYDVKLYDTWDCSYKCVGNFWTRKRREV